MFNPSEIHGVKTNGAAAAQSSGLDYSNYLSEATRRRPASAIRSLFPMEQIPGMLSLLAGKPNPETFPISSLSLQLKPSLENPGKVIDLKVPSDYLTQGLQYGPTNGMGNLNKWLVEFNCKFHGREIVQAGSEKEGKDGLTSWKVTVGNGSQDLLTKAFTAFLDEGDTALSECPAYTGILPQLHMLKANVIPVDSDSEGVSPEALSKLLSEWHTSPSTSSLRFPKFLYTTPTGANPAGTTASESRKRSILSIARQHKVLIFEDDPYWGLDFSDLGGDPVTRPRRKSYWAIEGEEKERREWGTGWVIRFESFSKILSAGLRLGYMTGPTAIVNAVDADTAVSNLQPSGVAQSITLTLLEHWGREGLLRHADSVAEFYRKRRDNFEGHASRILGTNSGSQKAVAEWVTPVAGMFLWLKLKLPPSSNNPEGDSYALISEKARAAGVLAVPGTAFMPGGASTCYVRTSFSLIPESDVEEALKRLRNVVLEAWKESGLELA